MPTSIYPWIPKVRLRIGDDDEDTRQRIYKDSSLLDAYEFALETFNEENSQSLVIDGSGTALQFTTTVEDTDMDLFVLYASRVVFQRERARAQRRAIQLSNAAGRTDMTKLHSAANFQVMEVTKQIDKRREKRRRRQIDDSIAAVEITTRPDT